MMITCACLNVKLTIAGSEITPFDLDSLMFELSPLEKSDQFFKQALGSVALIDIVQNQTSVFQNRLVGNWKVHTCLNCPMDTHAVFRQGQKIIYLVNMKLNIDVEQLSLIKSNPKFSPAFRILVNPTIDEDSSMLISGKMRAQIVGPIQTSLSSLEHQLDAAVQEEVAKTEERIRIYTEQQYTALEKFRDRTHREHKTLVRILNDEYYKTEPLSPTIKSPHRNLSKSFTTSSLTHNMIHPVPKSQLESPVKKNNNTSPVTMTRRAPVNRSLSMFVSKSNSIDSEGLFEIEGMDDVSNNEPYHSEAESDSEHDELGSHDEGIDIHRTRANSTAMAKSLPVNVPVYLTAATAKPFNIDRDEAEQHNPTDIAASIKALARSVHGEAVFGDLPPPRLSTQI